VRTGPTLIVVAIALAAGGFAGYRLAAQKTDAAMPAVVPQGDFLRGVGPPSQGRYAAFC